MNPVRSVLQALNAVAFQSDRDGLARTRFFLFFSAQVTRYNLPALRGGTWERQLVDPGGNRSVARSHGDVAAAAISPQYVCVYLVLLMFEEGEGGQEMA